MPENNYIVRFAPKAYNDLAQIYQYIAEKLCAEIAADNLLYQIEKSIMRLEDFPFTGSLVLDEPLRKRGYHKLVVDNYIVFYLVDEQEMQVVIMRIMYGARNYNELL